MSKCISAHGEYSEHTPTTEEVRLAHAESVTFHQMEEPELTEANSMFDRWLAARDARIEAAAEQRGAIKALRDAAQVMQDDLAWANTHRGLLVFEHESDSGITPFQWLRSRADRITDQEAD